MNATAKFNLVIKYDDIATSPREDDNLGVITYRKGSRYVLGDEAVDPDTFEVPEGSVVVNVYAYIHSGVALKAGDSNPFTCRWDSGQSGVIYAPPEKIRECFLLEAGEPITDEIQAKVRANLINEVDVFGAFLAGEVYRFEVTDEAGEAVNECGGFIIPGQVLRGPEATLEHLKTWGIYEYIKNTEEVTDEQILAAWKAAG